MGKNELPKSIAETQYLIDELLDFAKIEKNKDKRRELLLMSLVLKKHLVQLKLSEGELSEGELLL